MKNLKHRKPVAHKPKALPPRKETLRDLLISILIALQNIETALQPESVDEIPESNHRGRRGSYESEEGEYE